MISAPSGRSECSQFIFLFGYNSFFQNYKNTYIQIFHNKHIIYRHSNIYAVNVGTLEKNCGSKNCVNRGYLVVLKGRKIG